MRNCATAGKMQIIASIVSLCKRNLRFTDLHRTDFILDRTIRAGSDCVSDHCLAMLRPYVSRTPQADYSGLPRLGRMVQYSQFLYMFDYSPQHSDRSSFDRT